MNYQEYIKYAKKYNLKLYTKDGTLVTFNKLIKRVNDYESKKHKLSKRQQLYNNIEKYIIGTIDDISLDKALHYYIGA
jgi:protein required for attachment to host cells